MKVLIFAVLALAAVHADVAHLPSKSNSPDQQATVVRSSSHVDPQGFGYEYETSNGIAAQATGELKKVDEVEAVVSKGSFQYQAPDGTPIQTSFVADENGYQPQGAHLPVPPPIPPYILRSIEWIAAHPPQQEVVPNKPNRFA